jgi:CheY-like chemotaxis protein
MKETILVLDDDAKRISSHVELLQEEGFTVIYESDTAKMMPLFRENKDRIALVVLDMMMPPGDYPVKETDYARKTGILILRDIRDISKDVPVVVLSVRNDDGIKGEVTALGKSEYLEKPLRPSKLIEAIKEVLGQVTA